MSTDTNTPILPPWKDPAKIGLAIFTAFVFQLVILSGLSGKGLVPRITSDRVRFEVIPVDPRDMMRGDYITLGYEFSRLPEDVTLIDERIKSYKTKTNFNQKSIDVYVTLKFNLKEDIYKGVFFGSTPPTKGRYLRGKLNSSNRIEFGIESKTFNRISVRKKKSDITKREIWSRLSGTYRFNFSNDDSE